MNQGEREGNGREGNGREGNGRAGNGRAGNGRTENGIKNAVRRIGGIVTGLLYPARCPICDKILRGAAGGFLSGAAGERLSGAAGGLLSDTAGGTLSGTSGGICPLCRARVKTVGDVYCAKCGKPLNDGQTVYCHDCVAAEHAFTRGRSLFYYEDIRESVYRFKYEGRQEYASFYADETVRVLGADIRSWNADALIPIPLHRAKQKKRGYNQAALYAEALSARLGIPVLEGALVREQNTVPQKGLNREERQKNLKKAFKFIRNDVKLKTIILIDDIYTTGSTVDAAGALLKRAGIVDIYVITLASGNGV
ncbi:MAG: ComF family protein [Clostridium sp.]|nr:ComF family protein [Clostridium sp.]